MVDNLDTPYITACQIDFKKAALLGAKPASVCQDETKKHVLVLKLDNAQPKLSKFLPATPN